MKKTIKKIKEWRKSKNVMIVIKWSMNALWKKLKEATLIFHSMNLWVRWLKKPTALSNSSSRQST